MAHGELIPDKNVIFFGQNLDQWISEARSYARKILINIIEK